MTVKNKVLNSYLVQLPIVGAVFMSSSIFFIAVLSKATDYWVVYSLPPKLVGTISAYILVNHLAPGGNVNAYFTAHVETKNETNLSDLIKKYRNKMLVVLTALLFITMNVINSFHYTMQNSFGVNEFFFFTVSTFFIVTGLCEGVKYLSAWWNIRRSIKSKIRR